MFTRFSKIVLWLLLIADIIAAFALGASLGAGGFFVILFGGIVLLMFFGMFVELCNNVMDISQICSEISCFIKNNPSALVKNNVNSLANTTNISNGKPYDLSRVANEYSKEKNPTTNYKKSNESFVGGWTCTKCGCINKDAAFYCADCGSDR